GINLVNAIQSGALTRFQVANILVFTDIALQRVVTDDFIKYLGRTPVRNADPGLDETTPYLPVLRLAPAPGRASGDQLTILALSANAASFTYALATDPGTATVTGAKANNGKLDEVINSSYAPRETVASILTGSQEFRNKKYTEYYARFLSIGGTTRVPTSSEL